MLLRAMSLTDLDALVRLADNENVSRHLVYTFPHPYTRADGEFWIRSGSSAQGTVTRAIECDGVFAGIIGIGIQTGWRSHLGEIGYWLGEEYWGKGIATAALRQMTGHAFANLGLRKLYAWVLAPNVASSRVLEKNSYKLEGVLTAEVQKNGRYFDVLHFARQRS